LPKNYFPNHPEMSHDKWTFMIANALGGISVLASPVALYRRHETALTGAYSGQTLGQKVTKALAVSGDHYAFLAEVAEECGDYMQGLAKRTDIPAWSSAFRCNARSFYRLSEVQLLRRRLYSAHQLRERLSVYGKIAGMGGYVGKSFHSMGTSSALKDLLRVIAGSHL
jgi:hypothetical protein